MPRMLRSLKTQVANMCRGSLKASVEMFALSAVLITSTISYDTFKCFLINIWLTSRLDSFMIQGWTFRNVIRIELIAALIAGHGSSGNLINQSAFWYLSSHSMFRLACSVSFPFCLPNLPRQFLHSSKYYFMWPWQSLDRAARCVFAASGESDDDSSLWCAVKKPKIIGIWLVVAWL